MKLLALACAALIPASVTLAAAPAHSAPASRQFSLPPAVAANYASIVRYTRPSGFLRPRQTGATPSVTPTATGTAAPSATATSPTTTPVATATASTPSPTTTPVATPNGYPDPVNLLQQAISLYQRITSLHFQLNNDFKTSSEHFYTSASGDATCKNLALQGTFALHDVILGTSEKQSQKEKFIVIKGSAWIKAKRTKQKWVTTKVKNLSNYGVSIDNVLLCPNSPANNGSSSGGSSGQFKNLVNKGPATFQGQKVWKVQAQYITTDTKGNTTTDTYQFLIGQQHPLLYETVFSGDDPQLGHFVETQVLTKFGEKVTIKAPKVGSSG